MKEETKNRLKKFGKVTAYGLGLFAMLLLGVGLGNCSSKGASSNGKAVVEASLHDQKALSPKRALDPADYPTLGNDPNNLLRNASAGHFYLSWTDQGTGGFRILPASSRDMYLIKLGVGTYFLDYDADNDLNNGAFYFLNDNGADNVQTVFGVGTGVIESADFSRHQFQSLLNGVGGRRFILNVIDGFLWFTVTASQTSSVSLSLYDPLKAPAVASYDFPVLFNPYPLGGSPANGDFIFNGPNGGSDVSSQVLRISGLKFRSNGKYYNSIWLTYSHDVNQSFGHYDASGNFVLDGTLGGSSWYFRNMIYRFGTEYSDVVWTAKYENVDSNLAWKPALVSGGLWVSQDYRHIDVLSFEGSSLVDLPSTSLVGGSSVESVLKLISSYVAPSTAEMGNPFTLIREGFSAVGGVLQIQILPFMTLGTLIFVPLVVLVILAILKLLAK